MRQLLSSHITRFCRSGHAPLKATCLLPPAVISYAQRQPGRRTLASVKDAHRLTSEVFFTGSTSRLSPLDSNEHRGNDHRLPPDERTVKLGQSKYNGLSTREIVVYFFTESLQSYSYTHSSRSSAFTTRKTTAAGYSLSANLAPPVSFHTPLSSNCFGSPCLHRRPLDCTCCVGPGPCRR